LRVGIGVLSWRGMNPESPRPHPFKQQLPNWLTISRVLVILPVCLLLMYGETRTAHFITFALCAYAMITDFFDGYLSRKWGVVSDLGRLLDPVADKLLVAAILIVLAAKGVGHPLAVTAIMLRELFISGLREFMQEKRVILHVSGLAKYKTATQMVSCLVLLLAYGVPEWEWLRQSGEAVLWVAAVLTVITGVEYFRSARRQW
jgi:cardiolipin synthase (CMP-forming)